MAYSKKIATLIFIMCVFITTSASARGFNFIRDEEIEQMLKVMSMPIFKQAGIPAKRVKFIIVNDDKLNAFVAGGQNIFVNTGLILEASDASELIGVIAHETGHIASGHLLRLHEEYASLSYSTILSNLLGAAVAIGTKSAEAGVAVSQLGSHAAARNLLRHNRAQEGSADTAGVRFLKRSNLPTSGLLSFMQRLESQELLPESQQSEYVRTHPLTQDRISFLQHVVDNDAKREMPEMWNKMYDRIQSKLLGYLFPERALVNKSKSVSDRYARSIALFRKGRSEESLSVINELLNEEPNNPYFYELKGQILYEAGRIEESLPIYEKAIKLAPFSGLIRISYAYSLLAVKTNKAKNIARAIVQLNKAIKKEPNSSETHYLLAMAYGKQGKKGMSSLHLAEKAIKKGNLAFAKRTAGRAERQLKKGTPAYLRVNDIMEYIAYLESKQKKSTKRKK